MKENRQKLPVVALRGMTILPGMITHFDISREASLHAVEKAMEADCRLFLVTQMDPEAESVTEDNLYTIGLYTEVKQILKMNGGLVRVLVSGICRAKMESLTLEDGYQEAEITCYEDDCDREIPKRVQLAMVESVQETYLKFAEANGHISDERKKTIKEMNKLTVLMDYVANSLPVDYREKQKILEAVGITARYEALLSLMFAQTEIEAYKEELQKNVKARVDKHQKEYLMREQIAQLRQDLGEDDIDSDADEYKKQVKALTASKEVKKRILKEIKKLESLASNSSESAVARGYIETLLELPWDKATKDNTDLETAEEILEADHYGLKDVKERVLEYLAVYHLTKDADAPILCLVGPPGCGKTSIAKSIARAVGREYVRICLGGVRDEAEIRGHRKTYVGAMPGRIIEGLKQAKVGNPLMLLDEIDKVSSDYKGDTSSALLEVLDPEQNSHFRDHYVEMTVDLSKVMFLATANDRSAIPKPLLDRMEVIEIPGYTENEKFHIAKRYLVEKQTKKNGLKKTQISFTDKAIKAIISGYTREAGVRELERKIGKVCRKTAKSIYSGQTKKAQISGKSLEEYLGPIKFLPEKKNQAAEVGLVRGLAWTAVGGTTLEIEVNTMPGKGTLTLTGQLGDVMKESAQAALTYVRSVAEEYSVDPEFFEKHDIHVHVPEGATPKDGPSAGVTMATALLSAVAEIPVRTDIAMTGEITLRGRVLPIGGLKEKLLAANQAGMKTVCIPKDNERDLVEIDGEIIGKLQILPVSHVEEILQVAFEEK